MAFQVKECRNLKELIKRGRQKDVVKNEALSLYNAYFIANKDNLDAPAFRFNGRQYTHNELNELVKRAATAIKQIGIKSGDVVGLLQYGSVETPVCLLAISLIGAISKWISPKKAGAELAEAIRMSKISLVIVDPEVKEELQRVNEKYELNLQIIFTEVKTEKDMSKEVRFNKFLELGTEVVEPINSGYVEPAVEPAIIITTSGTTGTPKGVVHSNYSVNMAVKAMLNTDYGLNRNNVLAMLIPPYLALGLITSLYTALIAGTEIEIIRSVEAPVGLPPYLKQYADNPLNKSKRLLVFAAPIFFKILLSKIEEFQDLSFIDTMMAGGTKIEEKFLKNFSEEMSKRNCHVPLCNGYGQNEMCGAVSLNLRQSNINGSVGRPVEGMAVKIVDITKGQDLKKGQEGMILERSDVKYLYYENNEIETQKSKYFDKTGKEWFITGDYGKFDAEGNLYITDRASRTIVINDFKFSLSRIEEFLQQHPAIKDVVVVKINIPGPFGLEERPFAFVQLNDGYKYVSGSENWLKEIQRSEYRFDFEAPVWFEVIENIPYNSGGKPEYFSLTKVAQKKWDLFHQK